MLESPLLDIALQMLSSASIWRFTDIKQWFCLWIMKKVIQNPATGGITGYQLQLLPFCIHHCVHSEATLPLSYSQSMKMVAKRPLWTNLAWGVSIGLTKPFLESCYNSIFLLYSSFPLSTDIRLVWRFSSLWPTSSPPLMPVNLWQSNSIFVSASWHTQTTTNNSKNSERKQV